MKKEKKGGKLIIAFGTISIVLVTVCAFCKKDIIYKYYEYTVNKNYSSTDIKVNDYYLEDNFEYVNNYTDTGIKNKKELIDFIYYAINSGHNSFKRYIDKDYTNYKNDINKLVSNNGKELVNYVSNFNNFVHPYNSTSIENSINVIYGNNYEIEIIINRMYSEEEIKKIDDVVDNVIKNNITNDMPTKEKIKVIHDYIIDHAEYDQLKVDKDKISPYKSNTAYGVLIEGYGTCNGYADAMAIFLNKLNVINYKISNDTHIWNLVYLDGKWYHLDLTWDDPISDKNINRNTYFLITTKELVELNDETHDFDKTIYSEAL